MGPHPPCQGPWVEALPFLKATSKRVGPDSLGLRKGEGEGVRTGPTLLPAFSGPVLIWGHVQDDKVIPAAQVAPAALYPEDVQSNFLSAHEKRRFVWHV